MVDDSWCFVHAADLHLDTGFEGIGRLDEGLARRLRDASLQAFDALVDLTLERDAAFLVLAGDVYDGAERGLRAQLRFEQGVRRLADAGIRTFVAHGNHDPLVSGWQLVTDWPDPVHVFGHDGVESVVVERAGRPVAVVQGVSYAETAERRNLARLFGRTELEVPHVAVLHTNVGEVGEHANYAPCSTDDLRRRGIDYWALGHVHQRQVVLDGSGDDPWAYYPGNLQGRSPKATEQGPKGASVVAVRGGRVQAPEHVSLDRARFAEVTVDVAAHPTLGEVERALAAGGDDAVARADGRLVVLRGRLTGRGPVHHELARPDAMEELRGALADRLVGTGAAWTAVRDRTGPPTDADALSSIVDLLAATDVDDATVTARALATMAERDWPTGDLDEPTLAEAGFGLAITLLAEEQPTPPPRTAT